MRRAGPWVLVLFSMAGLMLGAIGVAAAAPIASSLEACDVRVRDHPEDINVWWCFHEVAAANGRFEEARRFVASRLAHDGPNYRVKTLLGVLERNQGEANLRAGAAGAASAGDDDHDAVQL